MRPLSLFIVLLLLASTAEASSLATRLAVAERAFKEGRFGEVLARLPPIPETDPNAPRAWFLQGYAHFKVGELEEAQQNLDRLDSSEPTPEVALLKGMVALGRHQWESALKSLEYVIKRGVEPWSESAVALVGKARREQAAHLAAERAKHVEQQLVQTKAHITAGQYRFALKTLDDVEREQPNRLLPRYYRGLIAYKRGEYSEARRHLAQALAMDRRDGWTRYMLALTVHEQGDSRRARRMLVALTAEGKDEVHRKASEALAVIDRTEVGGTHKRMRVELEAGSGLDTNPAYLEELPVDLEHAAMAIQIGVNLAYRHPVVGPLSGEISLRLFERLYAVGGTGHEQTGLTPTLAVVLEGETFDLTAAYDYTFALYGHYPLLSDHSGRIEAGYLVRKWLRLALVGHGGGRWIHDDRYVYLAGERAGGGVVLGLRLGWLEVAGSYGVTREWAAQVETVFLGFSSSGNKPGHAGKVVTVEHGFTTDYSFIGHGPGLQATVRLPWKLRLGLGAGLELRRYNHADTLTDGETGGISVLAPRHDTHVTIQAELLRSLPRGFEVGARYESVDNVSSMSRREFGLDRNYSRRQAGLVLRWIWAR